MYAALYQKQALTPSDILGPFYRPGAPFRTTICENPDLTIKGRVLYDNGSPVSINAYIEFWQADKDGRYDVAGPNYRGIQPLKSDGSYELNTIHPGYYDISELDAPQPHEFRCSHIHVKIWVDGRDVLTTQLYFDHEKYNETDHWFDKRRVIENGNFDFVIKS